MKDRLPSRAAQSASRPSRGGILQRKCACGNHTAAGGQCASCRSKGKGAEGDKGGGSTPVPLPVGTGAAPALDVVPALDVIPAQVGAAPVAAPVPIGVGSVTYKESRLAPWGTAWGAMKPISPELDIDIQSYQDPVSKVWKCKVTRAESNYKIYARLLAGRQEASDAVATAGNYCKMIKDLQVLGGSDWYVLAAVEAHEQTHVKEWRDSLNPKFQTAKTTIEALTFTGNATTTGADARTAIKAMAVFAAAINTAVTEAGAVFWAIPDPNPQTDAAEHAVVDPIVVAIKGKATSKGWAACP